MVAALRLIPRSSPGAASCLRPCIRHYHGRVAALSASTRPTYPFLSPTNLYKPTRLPSQLPAPRSLSTMDSKPQFAEGTDIGQAQSGLDALTQLGWTLDAEGSGIQKTFYFRTYFKSVSFVNVIASQSASKKHHATITLRIGSVDVHWTTHHPRGLTDKDIGMAQYCEEAAQLTGAVEQDQGKKCGPGPSAGV